MSIALLARARLDSSPATQGSGLPDPSGNTTQSASERLVRTGQIVLGLIWLCDGALQCQPYMFGKTFVTGVLLPNASGQPAVIASTITWIAHEIEPHVVLFNAFAAAVQLLIGVGLLYRKTVQHALLVSFAWASGIWLTGEGLGGFFNDTANPLTGAPGAVMLYVLAGLMVWPRGVSLIPERLAPEWAAGLLRARGGEFGLLGGRGVRWAVAALWAMFGVLWLLPVNDSANAIRDAILSAPTGTLWLTHIVNRAASATAGAGTAIALALAAISFTIAIGVLRVWHARGCVALSATIALVFWILQGFGGVFTGQATDLNTGALLVLIAWLAYGVMKVGHTTPDVDFNDKE